MPLLTYSQQQAIKPISANLQNRYSQIEKEVEDMYLDKLLGVSFAQDVQSNPLNYVDLLDGSTFTLNGETIKHKGIRYCLAYYLYAEYVGQSDVNDTYTGLRTQSREEAQPLQKGRIEIIRNQYLNLANDAFELIKSYLDVNQSIYPLYSTGKTKSVSNFSIQGIRKTVK